MNQENSTRRTLAGRLRMGARYGPAYFIGALGLALTLLLILAAPDRPAAAEETLRRKLSMADSSAAKTAGQWPVKVPAAEFAPAGGDKGLYAFSRFGGYVYPYDEERDDGKIDGVCLRAPVYLPDGVPIRAFRAHVRDDDDGADISRIELYRAPYRSTAGAQLLAATRTEGSGQAGDPPRIQVVEAPSVAFPMVDNGTYSYFALVCMDGTEKGNTLRLYTLVVDYGHRIYLPSLAR